MIADPPLRVAVFGARGIPSTYSGYETFLTGLLPALAKRGHSVTMFCRRGEVPFSTAYQGVTLRFLPHVATKRASTMTHGLICAICIALGHYDVVLSVNVANSPYCLIPRLLGKPVILNVDGQEWLRGKWGAAAKRYFRICAHAAPFTANGVVTDSVGMWSIYDREFRSQSTVIPYSFAGVTSVNYDGLVQYDLRYNGYAIIAARWVPENHVAEMAAAFSDTELDLPLVILGAANYRSPVSVDLDTIARRDGRVRLIGHVSRRDSFAGLLKGAKVYLHGHSVGGINPSLVEAMAVGAHVAALDTPFNREALGSAGHYFRSPADLTIELPHITGARPSRREDFRRAAEQRARLLYAPQDIESAYEMLLLAAARLGASRRVTVPTLWSE